MKKGNNRNGRELLTVIPWRNVNTAVLESEGRSVDG